MSTVVLTKTEDNFFIKNHPAGPPQADFYAPFRADPGFHQPVGPSPGRQAESSYSKFTLAVTMLFGMTPPVITARNITG